MQYGKIAEIKNDGGYYNGRIMIIGSTTRFRQIVFCRQICLNPEIIAGFGRCMKAASEMKQESSQIPESGVYFKYG